MIFQPVIDPSQKLKCNINITYLLLFLSSLSICTISIASIGNSQCPDDTVAVVTLVGQYGRLGWHHGHNWRSLVAPYTDPLTVMSMDHPMEPNVPVEISILMDDISLNDHLTIKNVNGSRAI